MELAVADWIVIVAFIGITLVIGLYFSRKAKEINSFFQGNPNLPWWVAGVSMVALASGMRYKVWSFSVEL